MAKRPLPTPEQLRQLLRYDPETGTLHWLQRDPVWFDGCPRCTSVWNKKWAGKEALTSTAQGYKRGSVLGVEALAHRVIIAMHSGRWPALKIDHIDGVRTNNRLENLREVTDKENSRNQRLSKNNTSGICGVSWNKNQRKWVAMIGAGYIGQFDTFEEAASARKQRERELGYHANHGQPLVKEL